MLQFHHYRKSYGLEPLLQIPDLTLNPGIYWMQGINGAGKTTLMKSIAGIIPFEGSISVSGVDIIKNRRAYRYKVNWAEAEPVYPDFLTGADLVHFYASTKGGSKASTEALLKAFGADVFVRTKIGTYSSGMLKKLSLVLALVGDPEWVLLDEPLITLDVQAVQTCLSVIRDYSEKGVSFLLTSHQPFAEAAPFAITPLSLAAKTLTFC